MVKYNFRKESAKERGYVYKCALECFGRSVEFGLSYQEVAALAKARQRFLLELRTWGKGIQNIRAKIVERGTANRGAAKITAKQEKRVGEAAVRQ